MNLFKPTWVNVAKCGYGQFLKKGPRSENKMKVGVQTLLLTMLMSLDSFYNPMSLHLTKSDAKLTEIFVNMYNASDSTAIYMRNLCPPNRLRRYSGIVYTPPAR